MRASFKKARVVNWSCVLPLLAYLAVAGMIIFGAITLERHRTHPAPAADAKFGVTPSSDLLGELAGCQTLGCRAEDDSGSITAWAEYRRRFFGGNPEPSPIKSERVTHP